MNKVICDICGTSYPENAEQCPICGYAPGFEVEPLADDEDFVLGYAFCIFQQHQNNNILTDIKTLYIDDLCVDKVSRGQHIGQKLYEFVLAFAKESNFSP